VAEIRPIRSPCCWLLFHLINFFATNSSLLYGCVLGNKKRRFLGNSIKVGGKILKSTFPGCKVFATTIKRGKKVFFFLFFATLPPPHRVCFNGKKGFLVELALLLVGRQA
jgi:hypothetical protein